ncbi:MAG: hypothetical protein O7B81_14375, partial [Gammaproteobacteria bacterium]|nr:hypothetical protein [Gammaproteobacteria bacterium]
AVGIVVSFVRFIYGDTGTVQLTRECVKQHACVHEIGKLSPYFGAPPDARVSKAQLQPPGDLRVRPGTHETILYPDARLCGE